MPKSIPVPQDPQSLRNAADTLSEAAAALKSVAASMDANGFEVIEVVAYDQFSRGLDYIERYAGLARASFVAHREKRGDFKASGHQQHNATTARPKKGKEELNIRPARPLKLRGRAFR